MSNGHTPGPWRISGYNENMGYPEPVIAGMVSGCTAYVAVCIDCPGMTDENASLIAAAPDLLEALEDIANDYAERFDMDSQSTNPGMKVVVENARAAIAKAKGQ